MTDEFNIPELLSKVEEHTPYTVVALQECERMNHLTREIQRSLRELDLGLKVKEVLGRRDPLSKDTAVLTSRKRSTHGTWQTTVLQQLKCPKPKVWACSYLKEPSYYISSSISFEQTKNLVF